MTTNVIAVLAAAGLLTAGVASATGTRSAIALPVAKLSVASPRVPSGVRAAHQADRPDCSLPSNSSLPACANPGRSGEVLGGEAAHHGVSAAVLAVLAAGGIGAAVAVAAKNDSNG